MSGEKKTLPIPSFTVCPTYPREELPVPTSFGPTGPNYRYGRVEPVGTLHVDARYRWPVKKQ